MVDVLVALLLLALVLTGACAALIQSMRATREALLATQAVDLAADVLEELRAVRTLEQAREVVAIRRGQARGLLPVDAAAEETWLVLESRPDMAATTDGALQVLALRWLAVDAESRELLLPAGRFRTGEST